MLVNAYDDVGVDSQPGFVTGFEQALSNAALRRPLQRCPSDSCRDCPNAIKKGRLGWRQFRLVRIVHDERCGAICGAVLRFDLCLVVSQCARQSGYLFRTAL